MTAVQDAGEVAKGASVVAAGEGGADNSASGEEQLFVTFLLLNMANAIGLKRG